MEFSKQTHKVPTLVNPKNFKPIKPKIIDPVIIKKNNSDKLNLYLGIGFVLFMIFFLWNCKYGIFRGDQKSPEPFSLVYNLNSV
jgi:hypothetical protein